MKQFSDNHLNTTTLKGKYYQPSCNSVDNTRLPCYTLLTTQHHSFQKGIPKIHNHTKLRIKSRFLKARDKCEASLIFRDWPCQEGRKLPAEGHSLTKLTLVRESLRTAAYEKLWFGRNLV